MAAFCTLLKSFFDSPELCEKYKVNPNIKLPPAKSGETAILRDLFFVGDQDILLKASEPALPKVLRFMQMNPDLKVGIARHINGPGLDMPKEPEWRRSLSERRAKRIYDSLLNNGIPAKRLTDKGYLNTQMLFPKPKPPEESEQNRRAEIRVLEGN
ncbi:MAG: OmpA family protein [Saprospiraceae bacterium]|nr:OmpA family protein [Saprospiraceae bacterium]